MRALLSTAVSLIVVDAAQLRLTVREHATLFERVAPGVPVVVVVRADEHPLHRGDRTGDPRWRAASTPRAQR